MTDFPKANVLKMILRERDKMKAVPYFSVVGSLMYAQVCTRPNIAFVVGLLCRYLSDPGQIHWKTAKKVLRYLQGTKDLMLTYRHINILEVVGFCDCDYVGYVDDKKSNSCYIFMIVEGAVFMEKCQAYTYNFFYYEGRICGML